MNVEALARVGVEVEVDGSVLTVTLNRPQRRNAQTPSMWLALAELGRSVPEDVRVVVVRGAGGTFSAGLDRAMLDPTTQGEETVAALLDLDDEAAADRIDEFQQGFTWLRDPRFVSIAAVDGYAIGAGFQLALACDLRVASEAAIFCMKESALGLVPDLTGTKPLVEAVGYSRALEICATARQVAADEALRIGLVLDVVAAAELDQRVHELVDALTAAPAGAVRETTALIQSAAGSDLDSQRRLERQAQVRRFRALTVGL